MIAALDLPARLELAEGEVSVRAATMDDLSALVMLLADDDIAATRGDVGDRADLDRYGRALAEIIADPRNVQLVVIGDGGALLGTAQLTVLPGLSRRGTTRLQVETVRIGSAQRSSGLGTALFGWITGTAAPAVGASLVQLTTDQQRHGARRFYERLGFTPSHLGFKYDTRTQE